MRPCLIDGILPANAVHLLGGSPGAGKTRFAFGLIDQWQRGQAFLSHRSYPVPYTFVSLDRPRASVEETLETMGLRDIVTRLVCLNELPKERTFNAIISKVSDLYPDSEMTFIEGFQLFAGDFINRYRPVSDLLTGASSFCERHKRTIMGVCHASKIKKGSEFVKGRDRIGGTVAWSAFSETIIIVDADEETKIRTIDIYPRNAPEERHEMMMVHGGSLIACPKEKGERLYLFITTTSEGSLITRQQLLELAEAWQIGTATVDRTVKRCVDENFLEPTDQGTYKRSFTI